MLSEIFNLSKAVETRTRYEVLGAIMKEVGELATEVAISEGYFYKDSGEGIIGEGVDVIICVLDLIWVDNPSITDEVLRQMIMDTLTLKLKKWRKKKEKI